MAVKSPSRFQPTFDHHRRTREIERDREREIFLVSRVVDRFAVITPRSDVSLSFPHRREISAYSAGPFKPYYSQDQISTRGASLTNVLTEKELHSAALPPFFHLRIMFVYLSHSFILAREISIAYSTADSFIGFFARFDLSLIVAGGDNDAC